MAGEPGGNGFDLLAVSFQRGLQSGHKSPRQAFKAPLPPPVKPVAM
jgi:hypothetical protein